MYKQIKAYRGFVQTTLFSGPETHALDKQTLLEISIFFGT